MSTASSFPAPPASPQERRERVRQEVVATIVAAAREVMREHGVAALNLSEVARRVGMRPQSLTEYFSSKAALYDALLLRALDTFQGGDEQAYRDHLPGWAQIEAWFANRLALADEHPDLHHLALDAPAPDYVPAERIVGLTRGILDGARRMVADAIAAGAIDPRVPVDQATDLLLAIRRGIVAERIGKRPYLPPTSDRFDQLLPDAIRMVKAAWTPLADPSTPRRSSATEEAGKGK